MRLMLFTAATLAAGAISAPACAALVITASVVDSSIKPFLLMESVGPFTQSTASAGIITPHFSTLNGVLTGASLSIHATVRNDVFLRAHPNGFLGIGLGTGETLAGMSITGAGFEPIQSAGVIAPYDLDLRKSLHCLGFLSCSSFAQSFKTYSASRTIDDRALGAYVQPGGQRVNATLYGAATCAALDGCKISNDVLFTTLSSKAQFEYLLHAAPSFIGTGQALDGGFNFGDVVQGSDASRGFNRFQCLPRHIDPRGVLGIVPDQPVGRRRGRRTAE